MKQKFYFERYEDGEPTGVTVCTLQEGSKKYPGFSFCHPGQEVVEEYENEEGKKVTAYVQEVEPDAFNKVAGKGVAYSRALRLKALLDQGISFSSAVKEIYSGRMLRRITEFNGRRQVAIQEATAEEIPTE